jgi:hypothetical protein
MSEFFWSSGHLGWSLFTLIVFTALWCLLGDVYWRLRNTRSSRFLSVLVVSWAIGVGAITLAFHLANR